ncbi:MAG: hypothetical protein Aurels2KO_53770 [Aureliella sp.]
MANDIAKSTLRLGLDELADQGVTEQRSYSEDEIELRMRQPPLVADVRLTTEQIAYLILLLSTIADFEDVEVEDPRVSAMRLTIISRLQQLSVARSRGWPFSLSQTTLWLVLLAVNLVAIGMRLI